MPDHPDAAARPTPDRGEPARPAGDRGDEAFRALADPTRRRMLDLLAERGTLSVGELAAEFPDLVFSGISKHLMALRAAGLVTATKQGRKQLYRIDEAGFTAALAPLGGPLRGLLVHRPHHPPYPRRIPREPRPAALIKGSVNIVPALAVQFP